MHSNGILCVLVVLSLLFPAEAATQNSEAPPKKEKKVYTNEDLAELKDKRPINQPEPRPGGAVERTAPGKRDNSASPRDFSGRDRAYWQKKIQPLRKQLEKLDREIAALEAERNKISPADDIRLARRGTLHAGGKTRKSLADRIAAQRNKRAEVVKSIQDVEEEARKAGALPEWVR